MLKGSGDLPQPMLYALQPVFYEAPPYILLLLLIVFGR